jgi:hypothetical protein
LGEKRLILKKIKMEVHHPHSHHGPKKWKEHFLEFFMLFLAVTLGFFAENQREHYVERHRETQYMESLVEDLKNDTAEFSKQLRGASYLVHKLDTALNIFYNDRWNDSILKKLYIVNLSYLGRRDVYLSERTSSQLKNAGGMRLIRSQNITDQISEYWHLGEYGKTYGEVYEELKLQAREQSYSIFNQKYYNNISAGAIGTSVVDGVKLMTNDKNVLAEFANRLSHIRNATEKVQLVIVNRQKAAAIKLLLDIKKEYHITDQKETEKN